jgi:hypothetical protein
MSIVQSSFLAPPATMHRYSERAQLPEKAEGSKKEIKPDLDLKTLPQAELIKRILTIDDALFESYKPRSKLMSKALFINKMEHEIKKYAKQTPLAYLLQCQSSPEKRAEDILKSLQNSFAKYARDSFNRESLFMTNFFQPKANFRRAF